MRGILLSFNVASKIAIFLSLVSFVYYGNVFTAKQVFMVTSYFNALYDSMLHFWPLAITQWTECDIAFLRIERVLLNTDRLSKKLSAKKTKFQNLNYHFGKNTFDLFNGKSPQYFNKLMKTASIEKSIVFDNCTAIWKSANVKVQRGIKNLTLKINESCAIVGGIGSGKSTILQVILGELDLNDGKVFIDGKISYASQEPWLFGGTFQENILFNEPFDALRYAQVIQVCALERDLDLLPDGDATMIGEHGFSLSGGQRARISLARAIYRQADIYLLDDPLSALDTHVGKHIYEQCLHGFLREKILILITHQHQYLKDFNKIVVMSHGRAIAQGNLNDIKAFIPNSANIIEEADKQSHTHGIVTVWPIFNIFHFREKFPFCFNFYFLSFFPSTFITEYCWYAWKSTNHT